MPRCGTGSKGAGLPVEILTRVFIRVKIQPLAPCWKDTVHPPACRNNNSCFRLAPAEGRRRQTRSSWLSLSPGRVGRQPRRRRPRQGAPYFEKVLECVHNTFRGQYFPGSHHVQANFFGRGGRNCAAVRYYREKSIISNTRRR